MRTAIIAASLVLASLSTGCQVATECDRYCAQDIACGAHHTMDECLQSCESGRAEALPEDVTDCAACVEEAACSEPARGACYYGSDEGTWPPVGPCAFLHGH